MLVRHGQTEWTITGQHTGRTDIPLTEEGRRQAKLVGPRLAGRPFAKVLSSPLVRALDTCRLAGLGERAELHEGLLEWDYGEYEGRSTAEIREERPGWSIWAEGVPGGETVEEVGRRCDGVIAEVRARAARRSERIGAGAEGAGGDRGAQARAGDSALAEGVPDEQGDVVVFGHGHALRVLAARWLGLPPDHGRLFALSTATISLLGYEREVPVLVGWNDSVHLQD